MYTITVTQKGQVVIPSKIRKKLHIKKGTKLFVNEEQNKIIMTPADTSYISRMKGMIKCDESVSEFILRERAEDFARMEKKWKK